MRDFFAFRKMITPFVIQVVFVLGLIVVVIAAIGAIANDQAIVGLALLLFGGLYWRIVCEVLIVIFRMNGSLTAIRMSTAGIPAALGGGAAPVQAEATPSAEPAAVAAPALAAARTTPEDEHATTTSALAPATPETAVAPATPAAAHPPAGWYDDSQRPGHKRWWDGTDWGIRDDEHPSAR